MFYSSTREKDTQYYIQDKLGNVNKTNKILPIYKWK